METDVDLTKLPIMHYTEKDGGKYIASAVSIVKDPQTGQKHVLPPTHAQRQKPFCRPNSGTPRNRHRSSKGRRRTRHCHMHWQLNRHSIAAATTLPMGVDELGMANALEKTDLVKCKTVDLEVPADCEFVLGRTHNKGESH